MDYTAEELEDLATMRALRERLRACAEAKVAECEAMLPAKNWLEMNRQIRAIMSADRMVISLYSPPPRRRNARRSPLLSYTSPPRGERHREAESRSGVGGVERSETPEDAVPSFVAGLTSPPPHAPYGNSVPGEVSAGAPCRMTEGASAVEAIPHAPTDPSLDPAFADIAAEAAREVTGRIDILTRGFARWAGIWPDGAPYIAKEANWQAHTGTAPFPFTLDEDFDATDWVYEEVLDRVNAATRAHGARTGYRFDHQPYTDNDPDYWSLSANTGTQTEGRAAGEIPGPACLPWWIIRKPPP